MSRSSAALLVAVSSALIIASVAILAAMGGGSPGGGGYHSLTCDDDGFCVPPESAIPSIIAATLAPSAFCVGLAGLLTTLVLHVVARTWPPGAIAAGDGRGRSSGGEDGVSGTGTAPGSVRRASSADPLSEFRPPAGRREFGGGAGPDRLLRIDP